MSGSGWERKDDDAEIYVCDHCHSEVTSATRWIFKRIHMDVRICVSCKKPTYFEAEQGGEDCLIGSQLERDGE